MEQRLLIVKNIPEVCNRDTIENYLEVVCDNGVEQVDFYDERAKHIALITFSERLEDVAKLKRNVAKRKLEGEQVELKSVSAPQGVIVSQLPGNITEDTIQFYFENKKSGGVDDGVEDCTLYTNLKCAVVTFTSPTITRNVLAVKTHTPVKNQPSVRLEPFYKGYQDEVIKFLNDLDPSGASGEDNPPIPDGQPTEASINNKIDYFQKVPLQETSKAATARQSSYEHVDLQKRTHSILSRPTSVHASSPPPMEKMTSVAVPETEEQMKSFKSVKKESPGMISINVKQGEDSHESLYETIDIGSGEKMDTSETKSQRPKTGEPPTIPVKPKRLSVNAKPEPSEEQDSEVVKFDKAHTRLLEKRHKVEEDFPACTVNYNTSTGEVTLAGPKGKLLELKLKLYDANHKISQDSCDLRQAVIDLISMEKGKICVEEELKGFQDSIWFVEDQKFVCLTFSESETKSMMTKVRDLVQQETVSYNESHFKYINGGQWKDLVQKVQQEQLVKITVERSKKQVKIDGLGKNPALCRDRLHQELKGHAHKSGEFSLQGARARCLKGSFEKELKEVKKIIIDSDAGGSFDDTGGRNSLSLKFEGDPGLVKKAEAELKKLEKKVWHETLHLKNVSAEKHVNLLIRGIQGSNMTAYQAAFEAQHSVYLDMKLPGAPQIQETFKSPAPLKHAHSSPTMGDDDDDDDDDDGEEELKIFGGFRAAPQHAFRPPSRTAPRPQQNTSITYGNITVTITKGDASKEKVDVFVNVVPKNLDVKGTALSQAYAKAGGAEFIQQFESLKPMWKPGTIMQTNCTGNLNGKMVYTFVLEKWNPPRSKKELSTLIDTCLKTADGNGYTSVALTSFGCGRLFHFPEKYVASCVVKAVKANSGGNLQNVSIVIYDHGAYQAFLNEIDPVPTLRHSRTMPADLDPFDSYPANDTITEGPTTISVKQGDITKARGTVLVNVVAEDLNFGVTAVAQALARAGGRQLIQEFENEKDSPSGNIIVTTGGQLNCEYVYHVILKKWSSRGRNEYQNTIRECFKLAAQYNTQSIVFPAIGCGRLFKYPDDVVAATLLEEAKKSNISSVTFMIYDQQTVRIFLRELNGGTSDDDDEDTSQNTDALRKLANAAKADKVPKGDNKTANIVLYGASKDVCNKARSKLSKQLAEEFLHERVIKNENLLAFKEKTFSKMKNMADRNGIWIKFPDPDKKSKKDTPQIKLKGEKNAVLLVMSEIQEVLLKEVTKTIPKQRKPQGARGSTKLIHEMAEMSDFLPPSYWKNNQSKSVWKQAINMFKVSQPPSSGLVTVDKATFDAVETMVQKTWDATFVGHGKDAVNLNHKHLKVKQVQRLENPEMFRRYSQKRSSLFRAADQHGGPFTPIEKLHGSKYGLRTTQCAPPEMQRDIFPEVNEHYLFHGTKMESIQAILNQGLDARVGGKGMLGSGLYGAESSTKADQYTDDKNNRTATDKQMLLMRMTLGQPLICKTPRDYCRPPCRDLSCLNDKCVKHNGTFDSVIADGTWNFREFVVYDGDVCYPEYIITYTRV